MLVTDLVGSRRLFSSSPRKYYSADVVMRVSDGCVLPPFTGKVVKSLLMKASPDLQVVFESMYRPKPISISTLVKLADGRRVYLWKRSDSNMVMKLDPGDRVGFHVGFTEDVADKVLDALGGLDGVELFKAKWFLEEYSLETYELPAREEDIPREYRVGTDYWVKVEFRTPTLFLDPYKASKIKRFLPLPGIVFSYNIGELLRMEKNAEYIRMVDHMNALLNEPYTILETVKVVKYLYDGMSLPGVTGYAKYMIDYEYMVLTESVEFLENILLHAAVMGVGTSRANGFGYVTIKTGARREKTSS